MALATGPDQPLQRLEMAHRSHTQRLLPMVEELLADQGLAYSDLTGIAFAAGPGSFTGVRIGTSTAQGLAFALQLPILPVSSLAALAYQAMLDHPQSQQVLTVLDARMNELYWAAWQRDQSQSWGFRALAQEQLSSASAIECPADLILGEGEDSQAQMPASLAQLPWQQALPQAQAIAALAYRSPAAAWLADPALALPLYLRNQVVQSAPS